MGIYNSQSRFGEQQLGKWLIKASFPILFIFSSWVHAQNIPVNVSNFARAESDFYFSKRVREGGLGKLKHQRILTAIDQQRVVRMNRDTLYSSGVYDLAASPVSITLPDAGTRFMSLQIVSQDHYTTAVHYAPGTYIFNEQQVGTRYAYLILRIMVDPNTEGDLELANDLQDQIDVQQATTGSFEVPQWDKETRIEVRDSLRGLGKLGGLKTMFGSKEQVDAISHLIATAAGWGGNPPADATYESVFPEQNDGIIAYRLTVKDVPVDGFWSISVYDADGYFKENNQGRYSVNNKTATINDDGSITIQFGGDSEVAPNFIPIVPGWNYTVRLYQPAASILEGTWKFPEAAPVE